MSVRVLVVEDEALAAEAHGEYVRRIDGFELVGTCRSAGEALRALERHREDGAEIDLLLLDLHLPDGHGLGLLQRIRAGGHWCDVIAVTSARDGDVVRRAVAQGVVLYLLKPFAFAAFRTKLEQYADYRGQLDGARTDVAQDDVDDLLGRLRSRGVGDLPKGMSAESLREITAVLRAAEEPVSATEVGERIGASRVTARRYLEHLATTGTVTRSQRYGGAGRPEVTYRWA